MVSIDFVKSSCETTPGCLSSSETKSKGGVLDILAKLDSTSSLPYFAIKKS